MSGMAFGVGFDEQVVGDANAPSGTFGRDSPECSVGESIRDGNQTLGM